MPNNALSLALDFPPYSSLWTPALITTGFWIDPSDSTTVSLSTGVSQINDKSGNNRHATQSSGTSQPSLITAALNSKAVIRFDGSNDYLDFLGSFIAGSNYTIAAVVGRSSTKGSNYYLAGPDTTSNANLQLGWRGNTTYTHAQFGNDYDMSVSGYSGLVYDIFVSTHSTISGKATYQNGSLLGSSSNTTSLSNWSNSTIGKYFVSDYYQGDVGEIIIVPSLPDYQILEGYLANVWGLTSKLPSNHPYKSSPPTT